MKIYLLLATVLLIYLQPTSGIKKINVALASRTQRRLEIVSTMANSLRKILEQYGREEKSEFIGRCIGVARKVRQLLPIIVFLLGVILTKLGFLTLFSVKTLGLVGMLLVLNASAIASKVAVALAHKASYKGAQPVHVHVHKDNFGGYHYEHSNPAWSSKYEESGPDFEWDRLETYNLYDKLLRDPYT